MPSHVIERGDQGRYQCVVCGCSWHTRPDPFVPCLGVWRYTPDQPLPDYLKSQAQLASAHLRPGGSPVGYYYEPRGKKAYWWWLYDEREARPRRQASEAQRAALATARQALEARSTCQRCHERAHRKAAWPQNGLCGDCRRALHRRSRIATWARALLQEGCLLLDTETTGLDEQAEVIELAAITTTGAVLLNTRIRPEGRIPEQVTRLHGITNEDVATAPGFAEVWPHIALLLRQKLLIYHAAFDKRLLYQSCARAGLAEAFSLVETECLMWAYAEFAGSRNQDGSYAWWSLADACWNMGIEGGNHSALGDCQASLRLLEALAQYQESTYAALLEQETAAQEPLTTEEIPF